MFKTIPTLSQETRTPIDTDGDGIPDRFEVDTDGDGNIDRIEFDPDQDGNIDRSEYDDDADGTIDRSETYTYNSDGNLIRTEFDDDNDGNTDRIGFDPDHDGNIDRIAHLDDDGRWVQVDRDLDDDGTIDRITHYAFDSGGTRRVTRREVDLDDDGTIDRSEAYIYEGGNRTRINFDLDNDGMIDRTARLNAEGRWERVELDVDDDGTIDRTVHRNTDGSGTINRIDFDDDADGTTDRSEFYTQNTDNDRTRVDFDDDADGMIDRITHYAFDEDGNRRVTRRDADLDDDGNIDRTVHLNAEGRWERVERDLDDDGTTDRIETYTYDENGNLTRAEFDDGADGMTDRAEDYRYNSIGRLTRTNFDDDNDGTTDRSEDYGYFNDRLTRIRFDDDEDNTFDRGETYTYDENGRLTQIEFDDDGDNNPDRRVAYTYDANGNRNRTEFDDDADGTIDRITHFAFDSGGDRSVTRRDADLDDDGNIDRTIHLNAEGRWERVEWDDDDDGTIDRTVHRNTDGSNTLNRTDFDDDGDGTTDRSEFYTQNADGNRDRTNFDDDADSTIDRSETYTYDVNDRVSQTNFDDDNDGTTDRSEAYTYNSDGDLIRTDFDDDNDGTTDRSEFDDDADGNIDRVNVAENRITAYRAPDAEGDTLVYSLSGTDAALFTIDAATGEVSFMAAPDFEAPGDDDRDNVYDIIVTASDGTNSTDHNVAITVTNDNDNIPVFTSPATANAQENQTAAYMAAATDADGDTLVYSLSGTDSALFTINADTGEVSFRAAPDFEAPGDDGGDNVYDIIVTASDGTTDTEQAVAITVTSENGNVPVFTSPATANARENQTAAYMAAATDADGDTLVYSLSGTDAALFTIDAATGEVSFMAAPDFEAPGDDDRDNVYDIIVTASDGSNSTDHNVAITVTDVNDLVPLSSLDGSNGFILNGIDLGDFSGLSVSSAGDVNGDGYDDLIIGAYRADPNGGNSGETYVVYGGANAPGSDGMLDLSDLDGSNGFILNGIDAADESGWSVSSAGDVNGDGYDDLIIGARRADPNGDRSGETYVVYGGASAPGTGGRFNLSTLDGSSGFILTGIEAFDYSGWSVSSAGDVNGDGYDDLIIGAWRAGSSSAGATYVVYGGASAPGSDGVLDLSDLDGSNGFILNGIDRNDYSGISVSSAGDVNGDGYDDLIIGAHLADPNGGFSGETYVVYGGASAPGTGGRFNLSTLDGTNGFILNGIDASDQSGQSVSSAGDVNGDGYDDLIIGAFGADPNGNSYAGETYVVYGGANAPGTGGVLDLSALDGTNGFILTGIDGGDYSGFSVSSAGDVNGDGYDDLIIGAYRADGYAGETYLVYGGASAPGTGGVLDMSDLDGTNGFILTGIDAGDQSGRAVSSAGDVNGDGYDDLIIGARGADPNGDSNAGETYVIYGGATGTESLTPVTASGTAAADNFTGNAGADSFTAIATDDVVRGGAGDDRISVTALDFAVIDGGTGVDTLVLDGAGLALDLTGAGHAGVDSVEVFDLSGTGANSLVLDAQAVFDVTEEREGGGMASLDVLGDADDRVDLSGSNFALTGTAAEDGVTYNVYRDGNAEVRVEDGVQVQIPVMTTLPVFTSPATANAQENQTAAYMAATDADGDTLAYSLSGTDAALFTIDATTGEVSFIEAPDFEAPGDDGGDNVYDIIVTASDGINSTDHNVAITVTNDNDNIPVFTSPATANAQENQTAAYMASATDADGDTLAYSLSGTDAALFTIDANTGEVSFRAAPDFEAPGDDGGDNVYDIIVTASDGINSTDHNVAITVTNDNDNIPVFTSPATANAQENQTAAYMASATDADGDTLVYSLSGTDAALFTIDAATGEVSFIEAPDFEAPGDDGGDNVYDIIVTASDGTNSTNHNVAITVTSENGNIPVFTSPAAANAQENQTAAYEAAATDADGDTLVYSLSGTDAALFTIDANTGEVSFIEAPDFEAPGDDGGDNVYDIIVTASDGTNSTDHNVAITVTNDNDNAPVFTSPATANAQENQTAAYMAAATDADGDTLVYSLSGTDAALFTIDANTGEVSFIEAPDFEAPGDDGGDNVYDIIVTASDGTNSTDHNVAITVTNDNDNAPVFTSPATANAQENQTAAYMAAATDADGDTLVYSLSGTDAALFTIDAATGEVSFMAAPDFEAPGDDDRDNVYDIIVTASDGTTDTEQAVAITVTNENDNAPVFTSPATANVQENQTVAYEAAATDADGNALVYSLSGTDAALFTINANTGEVSFIEAPDFEAPGDDGGDNVYDIIVTASDGTNSTDHNVAITVTNDNDNIPVFTSPATANARENQTAAYMASATDADGDTLVYSLSGTDAALFTIDADTGEVSFIEAPDFEAPGDDGGDNIYDIIVTASDGINSTDHNVAITVTNENDNIPVFTSPATANAQENQTVAYEAAATDADGDTLVYSLSGTDAALFTIDAATGEVSFIEAPDFEAPGDDDRDNVYDIIVTASDGTNSTNHNVAITVTNENDNIPVFTSPATANAQENQTAAYMAAATDADGDTLVYSLSGTDAALFTIDAATGEVSFIEAPDFEAPGDDDRDNVYDIIVTASDGTNSTNHNVAITVTNENDNIPVFTSPATANAQENQTAAYEAAATDADGDTLVYSLSGTDAALFTIDANTGEVSFMAAPDFEAPGDANGDNIYDIIVTASDGTTDTEQAVAITVTSENGNAPTFTSPATANAQENQTAAYMAAATDADGDTLVYSLSGTDAALFTIDADTGEVSFRAAPDFEAPGDDGGDNVYDIIVTASDGTTDTEQAVAITVTDVNELVPLSSLDLSSLDGTNGFILNGIDRIDQSGRSVSSAGDVNGDGYDDLIIGAPGGDPNGDSSGETYLVYGGASAPGTGGVLDLSRLALDGNGFTLAGIDELDQSGISVSSAGDVNGDGYDDLIIGAFGVGRVQGEYDTTPGPGEAYVVYGGATGADLTLDRSTLDGTRGFALTGIDAGDELGVSVSSAGDVNGDGYDDLIIGANGADNLAGETYIVYGGASAPGIGGVLDLSALDGTNGFILNGIDRTDQSGFSVSSAGDVNGDGYDDLIIGARFADPNGNRNAGETYIIYGGASAPGTDGVLDLSALDGTNGFILTGIDIFDNSGVSVSSAGDINGDGYDDLIIGASFADPNGGDSGETYIVYGGASAPGTGGVLDLSALDGTNGFILNGIDAADESGSSVSSAGDVNGDGYDDLIIGASGADPDGDSNAGETYIVYGGASAPGTGGVLDLSDLDGTNGFILTGIDAGDLSGLSVSSAGDVNGDGYDDLIIGARYGDPNGNRNAGETYVIYGGATGTESLTPVTASGTAAADNFTGNAGADSFIAIATNDVVRGGAGDDMISVTALDFAAIDGGTGQDILVLNGAGLALDLTGAGHAGVDSVEVFDLSGTGANSLVLDAQAVFDVTEERAGGVASLDVLGDADDRVDLGGGNFILTGTATADGVTYNVYRDGNAEVRIENGVQIQIPGTTTLPVFTSPATANAQENQTAAYMAAATDADGNALVYSLSGADAALFTIDANTGEVSFRAAPDFEAPGDDGGDNVYDIIVTASDGTNSTDHNVAITVTNENDNIPVFTSPATANAQENQTSAYMAAATDADGDTLVYSLSGTDAALFTIDATTGEVSFIEAPDFEAPGDDGGDNIYDIIVTASDGANSTDHNVAITVTSENDNIPVFTSPATANAQENQTAAYMAAATDADGDTLVYSLSGTDSALFTIDADTGEVSFMAAPDFEAPGDDDRDNVYDIIVTASDGTNSTNHNVAITVTNENDNIPVFTSPATANAQENQTAAYMAAATDADGDTLVYSLSGTDAALFTIDANTGEVSFMAAPDFEAPGDDGGDNVYDIIVTASDGANSTDHNVAITVTNENDNIPVFTSPATANAQENQTAAYMAAATDADGDALVYSLSGTDAALFTIDAATGEVSFRAAPDFEAPGDDGGDNVYDIIVTASDGINSTDHNVAITVTNDNDNVPVFTSPATANAQENQTVAYEAAATDADGNALVYSLSGTDSALFTIDADTGEVSFMAAPDFEAPGDDDRDNVYDITVTASDGTNSTNHNVAITVTNENDNIPVFTSPATANARENQTAAYMAAATDADGDTLVYSLSGTDAALFTIDADTGEVSFRAAPDFEVPGDDDGDNVYDIIVTASDGTTDTEQAVAITVTSENGNVPVFTSPATANAQENQTAAYMAAATDADGDTLVYSLSGTDAALFTIDAATGEVSFMAAPDFEAPGDDDRDNVYDITVTAFDGTNRTDHNVAITVTDVNELVSLSSLDGSNGFIINGIDGQDFSGSSVSSAGDVNGDGYDDLIIGVPNADPNGDNQAGETYVVYGGASAPGTEGELDLSALDGSNGFTLTGIDAGDLSGQSVSSAGDVNGDGYDDLIIGAQFADPNGDSSGETYIVYGGASAPGTGGVLDLSDLDGTNGFILTGIDAGDDSGFSVSSAGDVNGDGYDDLIIGATGVGSVEGEYDTILGPGEAYVVYGGATGADLTLDRSTLDGTRGFALTGIANGDTLGISVSSAGDVNGDGYDDLIIGADGADSEAGATYVVYGGASAPGTDGVLNLGALDGTNGFTLNGIDTDDASGRSVSSAGDVNGDGYDDLIIGARYADPNGESSGETYIVYGGASAPGTDGELNLGALDGTNGFILTGIDGGDESGRSVSSAGDVNGDGYDDLIIGAYRADPNGNNSGETYIVYGGASAPGTDGVLDLSMLNGTNGFILTGIDMGDYSGWSVSSAGDVNGDGYDDLIIGAPFAAPNGVIWAGETYIVYGGATGTESLVPVTAQGTAAADNFTGNAGDDSFTDIATNDVVRGGAGNDTISITALDFAAIDGGTGVDTLVLGGAGLALDLTGAGNAGVDSVEVFDLSGTGANSLVLDAQAVFDVTEEREGGAASLDVLGDADDRVDLSGSNFALTGTAAEDGVTYNVYRDGNAEVRIENGVMVTLAAAGSQSARSKTDTGIDPVADPRTDPGSGTIRLDNPLMNPDPLMNSDLWNNDLWDDDLWDDLWADGVKSLDQPVHMDEDAILIPLSDPLSFGPLASGPLPGPWGDLMCWPGLESHPAMQNDLAIILPEMEVVTAYMEGF